MLTLWQQSAGAFPADRPGLHHLAFEVADIDAVRRPRPR
ncbi:VOC family protein [Pseudonocardia sp.]